MIQSERSPENNSSVFIRSGLVQGASLDNSTAQEQKKKENEAAAEQPEGSDWRLRVCQLKAELNQDHQGSAVATGQETNQGLKPGKAPDSTCAGVGSPDISTLQVRPNLEQSEGLFTSGV